jgi:hypothetical protein
MSVSKQHRTKHGPFDFFGDISGRIHNFFLE